MSYIELEKGKLKFTEFVLGGIQPVLSLPAKDGNKKDL